MVQENDNRRDHIVGNSGLDGEVQVEGLRQLCLLSGDVIDDRLESESKGLTLGDRGAAPR